MSSAEARPGAAGLVVLAGMATLGLTDNFVPYLTAEGSLWQFHLIRGIMALALLGAIAAMGFGRLRPKRWGAVLGRSAFTAGAMLIYFGCLAIMPIGVVVAGLFTSPMFVLLIKVVFQGGRVGALRWSAVLIGFFGAVLVIRPDPAALDPVAFLPIAAGMLYAIGAVATRSWCEGEGTLALTAGFFIMLMLFGVLGLLILPAGGPEGHGGFALRGWVTQTPELLLWTGVQAVGSLIGIGLVFRAYQIGEAGHVAVFEYSLLVFASFWAWMLWGQQVTASALVGMALIAFAGAVIALRSETPLPLRATRLPE
ncbi:DMT family transporter [Sulfitobacter aestuarii]|uniref:DMT family transporter n=1 Tax=Sulfitobacter aestuarii TaxID=2161676 RepID=A0ABW5U6F6_9RHOB